MLKDRKFLYPTILLSVLWITQTIGFFGYSSWAPTLLAAEGVSVEDSIFYVALTTVGAPLGSFLAAMVTDRFERKWCLVVFGLVIAGSGLLYGLTFTPVLIVVFGFLVNLFERGYTALAYAYAPELFDTNGRSLGTSIAYGLGRLSNAAGPLMIAGIYNGSRVRGGLHVHRRFLDGRCRGPGPLRAGDAPPEAGGRRRGTAGSAVRARVVLTLDARAGTPLRSAPPPPPARRGAGTRPGRSWRGWRRGW